MNPECLLPAASLAVSLLLGHPGDGHERPQEADEFPVPARAPIQLSREAQHVRLLLMEGKTAEAAEALLEFDRDDPLVAVFDAWVAMQRQEMLDPSLAFAMVKLIDEGRRDIRPIGEIKEQLHEAVTAAPELQRFATDVVYEAAAMELIDILDEGRGVVLGDFTLYSRIATADAFSMLTIYGVYAVREEAFPPDELLEFGAAGPGFFINAIGFDLLTWSRAQDPLVVDRWRSVYDHLIMQFASVGRYGSAIQIALCSGVRTEGLLDWLLELLEHAEERGPEHVRTLQVAVATLLEAFPDYASACREHSPDKLKELFDGFRRTTPVAEFRAATECTGLQHLRDPRQPADKKRSVR